MLVAPADPGAFEEQRYSERYSCAYDGTTIDELEPRSFSFNSPHGACPACTGLGIRLEFSVDRIIPDRSRSIPDGAMAPWRTVPTELSWRLKTTKAIMDAHGWDYRAPVQDLPPEALDYLLFARRGEKVEVRYRHERGENSYLATFEGIVTNLERRYRETDSEYIRTELEKYMVERPCPTCGGRRLKPEALGVTIDDRDIAARRGHVGERGARLGRRACPTSSTSARWPSPAWSPRRSARASASWPTSASTT